MDATEKAQYNNVASRRLADEKATRQLLTIVETGITLPRAVSQRHTIVLDVNKVEEVVIKRFHEASPECRRASVDDRHSRRVSVG